MLLAYVGPDTMMPVASILGAIVGVFLMFGRNIMLASYNICAGWPASQAGNESAHALAASGRGGTDPRKTDPDENEGLFLMKILVVGLESVDPGLLFKFDDLPYLRRLIEVGVLRPAGSGDAGCRSPVVDVRAWLRVAIKERKTPTLRTRARGHRT